jgi:hypothetical protein
MQITSCFLPSSFYAINHATLNACDIYLVIVGGPFSLLIWGLVGPNSICAYYCHNPTTGSGFSTWLLLAEVPEQAKPKQNPQSFIKTNFIFLVLQHFK